MAKSTIEKFISNYLRNKQISQSREGYEAWLRKNGVDPTAQFSDSVGKATSEIERDASIYSTTAEALSGTGLSKSGYADYLGDALKEKSQKKIGTAIENYLKTETDNQLGYSDELERRENARIAAEKKAEEERIKAEAKAEAERKKAEEKAEAERIKAEEKAKKEAEKAAEKAAKEEAERIKAEEKAEAERIKAEQKAAEKAAKEEAAKLAAEAKAEAERIKAEEKAEAERQKAEQKAKEEAIKAAEKLENQAEKEEAAALKSYQKVKDQLIKETQSRLSALGVINYDEAYEYAISSGLDESDAKSVAKNVTEVARNEAMVKITNAIVSKRLSMNQAKEYALALGLSEEDATTLGELAFKTNESVGDIVSQQNYLDYLREQANKNK